MVYFACALVVATLGVGGLLFGLHRLYAADDGTGSIVLSSRAMLWFVGSLPIATCISALTVVRVHEWLLGPPPAFFSVDYFLAKGPLPPFLKIGLHVVLGILAAGGLLAVRSHTRLTKSAIVEQGALAIRPRTYAYSEIERITMSRYYVHASRRTSEHITSKRSLFVYFKDGSQWSPGYAEFEDGAVPESALAEHITARGRTDLVPKRSRRLAPTRGSQGRSPLVAGFAISIAGALLVWILLRKRSVESQSERKRRVI